MYHFMFVLHFDMNIIAVMVYLFVIMHLNEITFASSVANFHVYAIMKNVVSMLM